MVVACEVGGRWSVNVRTRKLKQVVKASWLRRGAVPPGTTLCSWVRRMRWSGTRPLPTNPAAVKQSQEECEVRELQQSRTPFQRACRPWRVRSNHPSFGAVGETKLSGFFLNATHVSHRRAHVRSGIQQILGRNYGRQSKKIEHTSRANQEELHEGERHVCCWTSCRVGLLVFNFDSNKGGLPENKLIGERTYFKLRNRVWELEVKFTNRKTS